MQTLFGSSEAGATSDSPDQQFRTDFQTRCDSCGVKAPTRYAAFHQHIGAIVLMFHQRYRGNMCRECIDSIFKRTTLTTLGLGWWGMISMIVTPFVLIHNVVRYLIVRDVESSPAPYGVYPGQDR